MDKYIKKKFFTLFWNNIVCENLFLKSKEEFLEYRIIGKIKFTTNRIIISNAQDNKSEEKDTIINRSENYNLDLDNLLRNKIDHLSLFIESYFNSKFKKSFLKLKADYESNPINLIIKVLEILSDNNREVLLIEFLQNYGFIGKNIKSFSEIEENIQKSFLPAKNKDFINENTINSLFEGIRFIKELYVNYSYKNLYNTNQILLNIKNEEDDFHSKIKLFADLYDSKIIYPSTDDAFIECVQCDALTYKGVFQLKINPKKLKDLKCPVCKNELTYFVPYKLDNEIYEMVKSQDGLILEALYNKLTSKNIYCSLNSKFLNDIDIDCLFKIDNKIYFVETKMYKQNDTTDDKIISKIKEHFNKLIKDVTRIFEENPDNYIDIDLIPLLLVNIKDEKIINFCNEHFEEQLKLMKFFKNGKIVTLKYFKNLLTSF
jgi:hypothetical protein